jgi:hypothetical protein
LSQSGEVHFEVKAATDVHIAIGSTLFQPSGSGRYIQNHYEVAIGGWGNTYSELRLVSNTSMKNGDVTNGCVGVAGSPLSANEFRYFRLDWTASKLRLSSWNGSDVVLLLELDISSKNYIIDRVMIMTGYGSSGIWRLVSGPPTKNPTKVM